jgi:hypothetical protein
MPRPGPRLPIVGVRFDPTDVDREAARDGLNRSQMVKRLIDEALTARRRKRKRNGEPE